MGVVHDVIGEDGIYRYRLKQGGTILLTSGGFLLRADADSCGRHSASDPEIAYYIKKDTP